MRQLPLFPELGTIHPKLTERECLALIERQLTLGQLAQCRWYLNLLWKRAIP